MRPAHCAHMTNVHARLQFIARDMWYPVCLNMQHMIGNNLRNVHCCTMLLYLFILYMILRSNVRNSSDNF